MFLTIMRTFIHTPNRGLNSGLSHCLSLGAAIKGCLLINIYLIYLIKSTDRLKILKFIFLGQKVEIIFSGIDISLLRLFIWKFLFHSKTTTTTTKNEMTRFFWRLTEERLESQSYIDFVYFDRVKKTPY